MIKNLNYKKNVLIILSFILLSLLSFIIIINTHVLLGQSDLAFHFRRILELKTDICNNNFLPTYSFNEYHGSSVMTFYPYINILPISIISIFIKSKILLIYIWYICNIFISFLVGFYSCFTFCKSKQISYIFSLTYVMSIIFLGNGLDDFGEITAFSVFPLVVFGTFALCNNNKYMEMTLGMTIIAFSHVLTLFISSFFIVIWMFLNIKLLNKAKIKSLFKSILLFSLLTSIIWVPVVYFYFSTKTNIFVPTSTSINGTNIFLLILKSLLDVSTSDILGVLPIFCLLISFIFYLHLNVYEKKILFLSLSIIFFVSNIFPWKYMPVFILKFFGIFQSPSRLIIIPWILLSYMFSVISVRLLKNNFISDLFISTCLVWSLTLLMLMKFNIFNEVKYLCKIHIFKLSIYFFLSVIAFCLLDYLLLSLLYKIANKIYFRKIKMCIMIIVIILVQLGCQYSTIDSYIHAPIINRTFVSRNITLNRNLLTTFYRYKINNSRQFKYLLSFKASPMSDYYPKRSLIKSKLINNNQGIYRNNKHINFKHDGYNRFKFNVNNNVKSLSLPILYYNNEPIKVYLDNHIVHYYHNKYNMILIRNVIKGSHVIYMKYIPNIYMNMLRMLMALCGILWIIVEFIFRYFGKRKNY